VTLFRGDRVVRASTVLKTRGAEALHVRNTCRGLILLFPPDQAVLPDFSGRPIGSSLCGEDCHRPALSRAMNGLTSGLANLRADDFTRWPSPFHEARISGECHC